MPAMSQAARKPRGPITLFCEGRRFRWATVAVVMSLAYPLSLAPASWLVDRKVIPLRPVAAFYRPILRPVLKSPDWILKCVTFGDIKLELAMWKMQVIFEPMPREQALGYPPDWERLHRSRAAAR